jgi:fructose-1,6-bisphosphatase I
MSTQTLEEYMAPLAAADPRVAAAAEVVAALARGAVALRETISVGALGSAFAGHTGRSNFDGDLQKELDVFADEVFLEAVGGAPVAAYASEELDHPVLFDRKAPLALAIDPLDGSSNIDANVSIGTIFSLLPVLEDGAEPGLSSFLQPGHAQVAAGFFVYGPQLTLVLTLGHGTQVFVYSPSLHAFLHAFIDVRIPARSHEFAINMSNYRFWDEAVRHYVDDCLKGQDGPHERDFNMRWPAALVADAYRILRRGGIYIYPGDSRKGYSKGRLRLVYEANPVAMLIEQAGGLASNVLSPILDLRPTSLHERVPLSFGSREEVLHLHRYQADPNPMGLRSPLFGSRGLFRG